MICIRLIGLNHSILKRRKLSKLFGVLPFCNTSVNGIKAIFCQWYQHMNNAPFHFMRLFLSLFLQFITSGITNRKDRLRRYLKSIGRNNAVFSI
jgi:hypothetical protein